MENLDSFPITFPYLAPQKSGSEVREVYCFNDRYRKEYKPRQSPSSKVYPVRHTQVKDLLLFTQVAPAGQESAKYWHSL